MNEIEVKKVSNKRIKQFVGMCGFALCMVGAVAPASATSFAPLALFTQGPLVAHAAETVNLDNSSKSAFINSLAPIAQQVASENDLYPSVLIAQASLESNFGTSGLAVAPNYNLFGIKGTYNGNSVSMLTWEERADGTYYQTTAAFRKYANHEESIRDYAAFFNSNSWSRTYYYRVFRSHTNTYLDSTAALAGTYATDSSYAVKLNSIISQYNLTQYDGESTNTGPVVGNTKEVTHTVVSGDSLWLISARYGSTVAQIMEWNGLSSNVIYVGQTLTVSKPKETAPAPEIVTETGTETDAVTKPVTTQKTHTVVSGDYLIKIGTAYGVSVAQLKEWNNLTGDIIFVGQNLKVSAPIAAPVEPVTPPVETVVTPEAPAPTTPTTTVGQTYKVVSGDTLYGVATKNGVSVAQLKEWNSLSSDLIFVGQTLKVSAPTAAPVKPATPPVETVVTPEAPAPTIPTTTVGQTYKVVSGDTLYGIATKNGVSVAQIQEWNALSGSTIYVGQVLKVSAPTQTVAPVEVKETIHKVVKGDTLAALARTYKTTVDAIKTWNGLTSNTIYIGQTLIVEKTETVVNQETTKSYTVKSGDTLWKVAMNNNTTVANLKKLNNLSTVVIYTGQSLKVA